MKEKEKAEKKAVGRPSKNLRYTSIAISSEADDYWNLLAAELGLSKIAVLEMAIRQLAKQHKIQKPDN